MIKQIVLLGIGWMLARNKEKITHWWNTPSPVTTKEVEVDIESLQTHVTKSLQDHTVPDNAYDWIRKHQDNMGVFAVAAMLETITDKVLDTKDLSADVRLKLIGLEWLSMIDQPMNGQFATTELYLTQVESWSTQIEAFHHDCFKHAKSRVDFVAINTCHALAQVSFMLLSMIIYWGRVTPDFTQFKTMDVESKLHQAVYVLTNNNEKNEYLQAELNDSALSNMNKELSCIYQSLLSPEKIPDMDKVFLSFTSLKPIFTKALK